ncbi:hypothetical protein [Noviherbaspirillum malthae]|uniref:hypothetical protein n=1 Tax=Noviherbaspirillum malthae TaxID=1260987 RepID=UPI0018906F92|nr:hypothetical protein [Noviherbaspirillum malthae]
MKHYALVGMLTVVFLTGCASTRQEQNAPQSAAASASSRQSVPVPATSAKKLVLNMSGPKNVTEAKDWSSFKEEWRATFADHAKEAGIAFSMQDGEARPTGEPGTLLTVYVNDYRMVGIGARVFFGVMTGNAFIDSKANFIDLKTGKSFGAQNYNTTSSAWHGVFGKMTPQQVDAVASGVFSELKLAR